MCGIFGVINHVRAHGWTKGVEILHDLTYFNRLRGTDALGMLRVRHNKQKDYDLMKKVGDPWSLLMEKNSKFKEMLNDFGGNQAFVAHNRLATKGSKDNEAHAHPFLVQKENKKGVIIMVHNGTINHFGDNIDKTYPGKTDSHIITKLLAAGMDLSRIEDICYGAMALVWYDSEWQTLNFFRNPARPFGFVETKSRETWFGSEVYTVAAAVDRRQEDTLKDLKRFPAFEHWAYSLEFDEWDKNKVPVKRQATINITGQKFTYEDGCDEVCEGDVFYTIEEKEGSKSVETGTVGGSAGSNGSNATQVEPFKPPVDTGTARPIHRPKSHYNYKGKEGRAKWRPCEENAGYSAGDRIVTSLNNYSATGRAGQTKIIGDLITFSGNGDPQKVGKDNILGMIGLGMTIAEIDKCPKLWEGVVSLVEMCTPSLGVTRYRYQVRDLKPSKVDDPFLSLQREIRPIMEAQIIEEKKKEKEVPSQYTLMELCGSCKNRYPVNSMYPCQEGSVNKDPTLIHLCKACRDFVLTDTDTMRILFEEARTRQANEKAASIAALMDPTNDVLPRNLH